MYKDLHDSNGASYGFANITQVPTKGSLTWLCRCTRCTITIRNVMTPLYPSAVFWKNLCSEDSVIHTGFRGGLWGESIKSREPRVGQCNYAKRGYHPGRSNTHRYHMQTRSYHRRSKHSSHRNTTHSNRLLEQPLVAEANRSTLRNPPMTPILLQIVPMKRHSEYSCSPSGLSCPCLCLVGFL